MLYLKYVSVHINRECIHYVAGHNKIEGMSSGLLSVFYCITYGVVWHVTGKVYPFIILY